MRLLLKWLRPDTVPSPGRKNLPFGTRLRLDLYRSALNLLAKHYKKHAFFDTLSLPGSQVKLIHEFRDTAFEAELKRMHMLQKDQMVLKDGCVSSKQAKKNSFFFKQFHFEDVLVLDTPEQRVIIRRGSACSFEAARGGKLKESEAGSLVSQYQFTGASVSKQPVQPSTAPNTASKTETGSASRKNVGRADEGKKGPSQNEPRQGPLFGRDPLLHKKGMASPEWTGKPEGETKPEEQDKPAGMKRPFGREKPFVPPKPVTPPVPPQAKPLIKHVEGVDIDESF